MSASGGTSFDARIVLRPRSLDETYDLALGYLRLFHKDFWKMFLVLPLLATGLLVPLYYFADFTMGQCWALAFLLSPMIERVVTVYAGRHLFGNPTGFFKSIGVVLRSLIQSIFSSIVIMLPWVPMLATDFDEPWTLVIGLMLAVVWPFLLAAHVHLGEVALLEQLPFGRALSRSRALVAYRFGRALGQLMFSVCVRALVVVVVYTTVEFMVSVLLQISGVVDLISVWVALFGFLFAGPYIAVARLFDYVDARTRREGWDIQVRFNAIAQRVREEEADRLAA